ncbi:MAG: SpaH/EbpB family LPXTG-anchored major pilin [Lachnospiraceae bacterium]|jgi:fimbrial isopeptide formation D2 family protein/LPXTG-motif cell wall-anchored protein|nr:SpaH/EbpB family LPXTG-anchored major pilin [Lachnospiraceae bacterium]MCH4063704.1 SpaH/EbpB family LPXTG-anchored major pilin [Lachnospiraceae bacterium]MCH4103573.1 SpaH/EbpB family LPXTG-anchored major pilin [Lachnospiraceae bacterium]MCI1310159.1 SpaH/EbpB family LPXTG-anchored major pilin [Lachnospiraceae bacterium]MCI1334613.1 SpaH/EbpB family LPXTG-anchored major pilin [Lachnospiraceae bacterium]
MKHLKKLAALLLAVVMTMAMSMTAFAADGDTTTTTAGNYKLTLNNTAEGHTYEVYQIFTGDLKADADGSNKVLSNVKWGTGVTYTGTKTAAEVAESLKTEADLTSLLNEDDFKLATATKTVQSSKVSTVIDGLAAGYYLVKDKDGTQDSKSDAYTKFIVQVVGDTEANVKSSAPTVEKKVKDTNDSDGTTTDWQDSADYDIGDSVPYQITGSIPSTIADYTTYKYEFTDTMSKGLTYTANTATITVGGKAAKIGDNGSFTEATKTNDDGSTTVTWSCTDLKALAKTLGVPLDANTKVVVTYSAQLNKDAVIGAKGNPNTVYLTFSNNPNNGGEGNTGKTPEDKNIVFTYKTVVNKVDQDQKPLAGAAFKLEKKQSDGKYTEVRRFTLSDDKTTFTFTGLDDGDYKLTETTTPAGYNTINPIEFTISADHDVKADDPKLKKLTVTPADTTNEINADTDKGSVTAKVINKKGSVLPSTGGVGTRMFYVFGGCLVAAAVVLLALKKRKDA